MNNSPKMTQKQIDFVHNYLETKSMTTAYRYSYNCEGMNDATIRTKASRLMKNEKIRDYLEECRLEIKENVIWDRSSGTQELLDVLYLAKTEGKFRDVIRAVETLDKKFGYDVPEAIGKGENAFDITFTTEWNRADKERLARLERFEKENGRIRFTDGTLNDEEDELEELGRQRW